MELVTIIIMLALLQYIWTVIRVGGARGKYGIEAPATTGDPMFERHFRVQMNTLELLVVFVPAVWCFGYYVGQYWAVGLGLIYLTGRILYAITYVKDPASRGPGVLLSMLSTLVMVLGGLAGAGWKYLSGV
ncbi:MAG: MAPEG family protein [Pseudomonadales bacterium]|nr:MAPEG family protein [Pseudomonadales bacterium]